MTDFYQDTDAAGDTNNGTTWALAKKTHEGLLGVMSAGDEGWTQGAAVDTAAATRTLTSPGTSTNPCKITGVVDGTTNEPPVLADLAVTLPKIECTGVNSDLNFGGTVQYRNIHFQSSDRGGPASGGLIELIGGKLSFTDFFTANSGTMRFIDSVIEPLTTAATFLTGGSGIIEIYGGSHLFTAAADLFRSGATSDALIVGSDLSGLTNNIVNGGGAGARVKIMNCKMPASFSLYGSTPTDERSLVEVIASDNSSSVGATSSIQSYQSESAFGTVDIETTAVRTGGADDGATGAFSYAMTPHANAVLESSCANLVSPWIGPIWAEAGSSIATVYVANDGAGDYNEDEMWTEFYTVDVGDTAQHDQTFDPAGARLFNSSTAITDDTGSTWGTGGNNHQKMSTGALTYGFEGPIYARVHVAKRQATPDTVFVDPLIEVT